MQKHHKHDKPDHGHHHHHGHHHGHHHHPHSGMTEGDLFDYSQHHSPQYHYHANAGAQTALQACLQAVRGLPSRKDREALLGLLSATLAHAGDISGLEAPHCIAMSRMNHYGIEIE